MALLAADVAASYCSTAFDTTASRFSDATDAIDVICDLALSCFGITGSGSVYSFTGARCSVICPSTLDALDAMAGAPVEADTAAYCSTTATTAVLAALANDSTEPVDVPVKSGSSSRACRVKNVVQRGACSTIASLALDEAITRCLVNQALSWGLSGATDNRTGVNGTAQTRKPSNGHKRNQPFRSICAEHLPTHLVGEVLAKRRQRS
ncbi:hypothetical protein KCU61_g634, partial [Aureobasidium melanogenum]